MLKKGLGGIIFLLLLTAGAGYSQSVDTVLIISIDALHPDALVKGITPVIGGLMKQGIYTLTGQSVDPPKTLIAHTAMFTGLEPSANGKTDNEWKPGGQRVTMPTVFNTAKRLGYRTAFFYSKPKLGYLVNGAVDEHALSPDDGVDRARAFISKRGRTFVVLHLSGLEYDGMEYGWLSKEYLDTFAEIDRELAPLFDDAGKRGRYLIIVTSDHGGHDRQHGTSHPDDFRVPLIIASEGARLLELRDGSYRITGLKDIVEKMLLVDVPPQKGVR
jgi:arylsulfatase A-like enzyme